MESDKRFHRYHSNTPVMAMKITKVVAVTRQIRGFDVVTHEIYGPEDQDPVCVGDLWPDLLSLRGGGYLIKRGVDSECAFIGEAEFESNYHRISDRDWVPQRIVAKCGMHDVFIVEITERDIDVTPLIGNIVRVFAQFPLLADSIFDDLLAIPKRLREQQMNPRQETSTAQAMALIELAEIGDKLTAAGISWEFVPQQEEAHAG